MNIITETLLVTALIPMPPVKPENLSKVIRQKKNFLNPLKMQTSVLEASKDLVYERSIPYHLCEYLANPKDINIRKIIDDATLIAAVLDSDCFNEANFEIEVDGLNGVTDFVEISNNSSINGELHFDFTDVLKTDGNSFFWTNLYRNLAKYRSNNSQLKIDHPIRICHSSLRDYTIQAYKKMKEEYLNGNWFFLELFNKQVITSLSIRHKVLLGFSQR